MSVTSLSFTFVNLYSSAPASSTAATDRKAQQAPAESKSCGDARPAPRQNRLVEAMMSALRELGFGSSANAGDATTSTGAATSAAASSDAATTAATPAAAAATTTAAAATTAVAAAAPATATDVAAATTADATATSAAAATTDTTAAGAAAPAGDAKAAEPAVTLESAVREFAHQLFSALRQVGRGDGSNDGDSGQGGRVDGDGNGRRHHHGHHGGWRRDGYGDMSQRLQALSQTFAAPAAVAGASDAAGNAAASSLTITLTVKDGADAAAAGTTTNSAGATPADAASSAASAATAPAASAASPAAASAGNPLLDAFSKLFGVLKPESAGASSQDMADKLHTFLQSLAQSMRTDHMDATPTPQVGSLVDVSA